MLCLPTATAFACCLVAQDVLPAPTPAALSTLTHAEISERVHAAVARGAVLLPVGKSRAGRTIEALELSANKLPGKPTILVVANVDGDQAWTSSLALFEVEQLLDDPAARALLELATVIVIPCANPDAHEQRFAKPRTDRAATGTGIDNDRDGAQGEDPPSDVDSDGMLTALRVAADDGEWIADANDARALAKADAKKGERGRWKLWPEGRDLDHDEKVAEDALFDALVQRNFPYGYVDLAADAGVFPTDEPEVRALAEFVLLHPEIALTLTYGSYDNLVEKPKTTAADARDRLVPNAGVVESDADLLVELGKRYVEITGNKAKGRGGDAGTLQGWLYAHGGIWSLAVQPWDIPLDAKDERSDELKKKLGDLSDDAKRLQWIAANPDEAWRFVAWHPVQHPELGACEVGGFAPFARTEPPAARSREIAQKELEFLCTLGAELARIEIEELSARALGGDLYEVKAAVVNAARLPFQSASALRTGTLRPLRVRLGLADGATLVAGSARDLERNLRGAGGRKEYRWLVRTTKPADIGLSIDTDHAGCAERSAEVK